MAIYHPKKDLSGTKRKKGGKIKMVMYGFQHPQALSWDTAAAIGMYKVPEEDIQMFIRVEKFEAARHHFPKYQYSPNEEDTN